MTSTAPTLIGDLDSPLDVLARQVVLYVHLSESAITGADAGLQLARVENRRPRPRDRLRPGGATAATASHRCAGDITA